VLQWSYRGMDDVVGVTISPIQERDRPCKLHSRVVPEYIR